MAEVVLGGRVPGEQVQHGRDIVPVQQRFVRCQVYDSAPTQLFGSIRLCRDARSAFLRLQGQSAGVVGDDRELVQVNILSPNGDSSQRVCM